MFCCSQSKQKKEKDPRDVVNLNEIDGNLSHLKKEEQDQPQDALKGLEKSKDLMFESKFFDINDEEIPEGTDKKWKQPILQIQKSQNPFKQKRQNHFMSLDDCAMKQQKEQQINFNTIPIIQQQRAASENPQGSKILKKLNSNSDDEVEQFHQQSRSKHSKGTLKDGALPDSQPQSSKNLNIHDNDENEEELENQEEVDDDDDDDKELNEQEAEKAALYRWSKENVLYSTASNYEEIQELARNFKIIDSKVESRNEQAHKSGGKQCKNKKMVKTIRAIGKQVLSGNFNLTTVSFPIRAMIPKSALEKALQATCLFPYYINRACQISDPIEKMKLVICATIGNFYINCSFLKPLNPILGETIEVQYKDGTKLYAEQISHHPPVSYFLVIGPMDAYKFYGYYNYEAKAGLNSLTLKNRGKRYIKFKTGELIEYNFASEEYCGNFWGPMKVEVLGKMNFQDKANNLQCELELNNVRWQPTDYFQGDIKQKGKRVSKVYGTYMGYIEFDQKRYWDQSYILPHQFQVISPHPFMKSDQSFRQDRKMLMKRKLDEAQQEKEELEALQRTDGKLRQKYQKEQKELQKKNK